jgi:hypothetical protein
MVLEKVKIYLDGTMLRFESDDAEFKNRSIPTGRVEVEDQGSGFVFTDVVHETLICSVDSFDDVLDASGVTYGADIEAVKVALNAFLNFKTGGGGGTDTNFANTDLVLDDNRLHDFDGNYMLLNSVGFTDPVSVEPSFVLDPLGGLFGASVIGFKSGLLGSVNTTLLQQDDGAGLKTVITTQDPANDLHFLQVTQSGVFIAANNGGDINSLTIDKTDGIEIKVEQGDFSIDIPSADAVGKVLAVTNATSKQVGFINPPTTGGNAIFQEQYATTTSAGALFVTRHTFNGNLDVGSYEISFFTYMGAGGAFAELRNGLLINGVVEYDRGFSTFFVVEQAYPNTFILDVTTAGVFNIQAQFRRVTAGITVDCNFSNLIIKKIA